MKGREGQNYKSGTEKNEKERMILVREERKEDASEAGEEVVDERVREK